MKCRKADLQSFGPAPDNEHHEFGNLVIIQQKYNLVSRFVQYIERENYVKYVQFIDLNCSLKFARWVPKDFKPELRQNISLKASYLSYRNQLNICYSITIFEQRQIWLIPRSYIGLKPFRVFLPFKIWLLIITYYMSVDCYDGCC